LPTLTATGETSPAAAADATPANENEVRCHECGSSLHRVSAIQYGTIWICPACKPAFLQKLQAGAPLGPNPAAQAAPAGGYIDPGTLVANAIARQPLISPTYCLGRAWALLRENLVLLAGATAVNILCQVVVGVIPGLGMLVGPLIQGPLIGSLYWMNLRAVRGQTPAFGDAFSGFNQFVQLMMAGVVTTLLTTAMFVPAIVFLHLGKQGGNDTLTAIGGGLGLLALPFAVYFAISWLMTYPLVMDRKYDFWTAMHVSRAVSHKCWGSLFALFVLLVVVQFLGLLALCVGIFVTLPLFYGALAYAYEDVFNGAPRR
jgi:hypothetical protein